MDFKIGHGNLQYLLWAVSWSTTVYFLLIENVPFLKQVLPSYTVFFILFIIAYPLGMMAFGMYIRRKRQYSVELDMWFENIPRLVEMENKINSIYSMLTKRTER